jgi:hypothetical protein
MAKKPKSEIADEPGAEDRFLSGVRKALETPHKPHKPTKKSGSKGSGK